MCALKLCFLYLKLDPYKFRKHELIIELARRLRGHSIAGICGNTVGVKVSIHAHNLLLLNKVDFRQVKLQHGDLCNECAVLGYSDTEQHHFCTQLVAFDSPLSCGSRLCVRMNLAVETIFAYMGSALNH